MEQEVVAAGAAMMAAICEALSSLAAPVPNGGSDSGEGAAAAATYVALLLDALLFDTSHNLSPAFLLRFLVPHASLLADATGSARPSIPSEAVGARLLQASAALRPAVVLQEGGAAGLVVWMRREALPTVTASQNGGDDDPFAQLRLALWLLAAAAGQRKGVAVEVVDAGGVALVKAALALLLDGREEEVGEEERVTDASSANPAVVVGMLQRAVRRGQEAMAVLATEEGQRRKRRRVAVAVALLELMVRLQEGQGPALSLETALGLLPRAIALHARLCSGVEGLGEGSSSSPLVRKGLCGQEMAGLGFPCPLLQHSSRHTHLHVDKQRPRTGSRLPPPPRCPRPPLDARGGQMARRNHSRGRGGRRHPRCRRRRDGGACAAGRRLPSSASAAARRDGGRYVWVVLLEH